MGWIAKRLPMGTRKSVVTRLQEVTHQSRLTQAGEDKVTPITGLMGPHCGSSRVGYGDFLQGRRLPDRDYCKVRSTDQHECLLKHERDGAFATWAITPTNPMKASIRLIGSLMGGTLSRCRSVCRRL